MIRQENAFTILELLFTVLLISIISAMAVQSYTIYKQKAQHGSALSLFNQTRSALEGGKINSESESFSSEIMEVEEMGPGFPGGDYGQILLSGLVIPENHKVYVRHATTCDDPTCVVDLISVRHCGTSEVATLVGFHGGATVINQHAVPEGPCS